MTEFTKAELDLLATATVMAEAGVGFTLDEDRIEERAVADRLVASGHLEAVEDVEDGYRLSDDLLAAHGLAAAMQAEGATLN